MTDFETHANFHLELLGDREKYYCFAKNHRTGETREDWLRKGEILNKAKDLNAEGFTFWISLNDKDGDSIEGTKEICDIWFDIDPIHPDDQPATEEECKKAITRAYAFKAYIEKKYHAKGFLAFSGNGCHIHFPVIPYPLPPEERYKFNKKLKAFTITEAATAGIKIDSTYDIRRVTTLIGSLNLKIPNHPLKTGWDVELSNLEAARKELEDAKVLNFALIQAIEATPTEAPSQPTNQVKDHPVLEMLFQSDQKLKDLYVGD